MPGAKAQLPTIPPARNEPLEELLEFINEATCRHHNPLVAVQRFGHHLDAPLKLTFGDGDAIRIRQRDLISPSGLRQVLMAYDGTSFPDYGPSGCSQIVARIIWAGAGSIVDDELDVFLGDVGAFLIRSIQHGILRRDYSQDGYSAIS